MVKKYLKYEWISMCRWWIPMACSILGLALLGRLSLLPSELSIATSSTFDVIVTIFQGLCGVAYFLGILAMGVITEVMIVVRFYKNMLSREGYLTFSIPISVTKQLFCKTLMSVFAQLSLFFLIFLSVFIYGVGTKWFNESLTVLSDICEQLPLYCSTGSIVLGIFEILLVIVAGVVSTILLYYACISVGQLMSKYRILGALLAYGGWYVITQIFSFVFSVVFVLIGDQISIWLENLENIEMLIHCSLWIVILVNTALSVLFFFISQKILTKKLNLE